MTHQHTINIDSSPESLCGATYSTYAHYQTKSRRNLHKTHTTQHTQRGEIEIAPSGGWLSREAAGIIHNRCAAWKEGQITRYCSG